jgi:hypothetical protein
MTKTSQLVLGLVLCSLVIGCSQRTSVRGTVRYDDGEPLTFGVVKFVGPKIQATGKIQKDGTYVMDEFNPRDGVTPGVYQIAIAGVFTGGGSDGTPVTWHIDPKFDNPGTSGLTYEVGRKSVVHDITVTRPSSPGVR